jgi:hypothetical protein
MFVCGMVATTLLVLATVWALFGGWLAGVPFVAAMPAALASLVGWLTSAWRRQRPWVWWVWTIGVAGVLLLLLFHPDSRARIEAAPSEVR